MVLTWVKRALARRRGRLALCGCVCAVAAAALSGGLVLGGILEARLAKLALAKSGGFCTAIVRGNSVLPGKVVARLESHIMRPIGVLLLKGDLVGDGVVGPANVSVLGVRSGEISRGDAEARREGEEREEDGAKRGAAVSAKPALPFGSRADARERSRELLPHKGVWCGEALQGEFTGFRVVRPQVVAAEVPFGSGGESAGVRLSLSELETRRSFGGACGFSFERGSGAANNLWVNREWLSAAVGVPGGANVVLSYMWPELAREQLGQYLGFEAAGVFLSNGVVRSREVFLPRGVVEAFEGVEGVSKGVAFLGDDVAGSGFGFVLAHGERALLNGALLPEGAARKFPMDVKVAWRFFGSDGRLVATQAVVRVEGVFEESEAAKWRGVMPAFPGLEGADSCADWDVGFALDEAKLRDPAVEAYWKKFRETPKLVVPYELGAAMFGGVLGSVMVLDGVKELPEVSPEQLGFVFRDLRAEARVAGAGANDLKGLFGGMAFVVVVSALLLVGLVLGLDVAGRSEEIGVLRVLGFGTRRIGLLLLAEYSPGVVLGSGVGACLGVGVAGVLPWLGSGAVFAPLAGVNGSAVGKLLAANWGMVVGCVVVAWGCVAVLGLLAAWVALRAKVKGVLPVGLLRPTVGNLTRRRGEDGSSRGGAESRSERREEKVSADFTDGRRWRVERNVVWGVIACVSLVTCGVWLLAWPVGGDAGGAFFGGGFCLLGALLVLGRLVLGWLGRGFAGSAWRGVARYGQAAPSRALLVAGLIGLEVFVCVGIVAMLPVPESAGTGGFDEIVTASRGLSRDEVARWQKLNGEGAVIVPCRVLAGDVASCLNLNKTVTPQVVGCDLEALAKLGAFANGQTGVWERIVWDGESAVPVLGGDQTTLAYGLKVSAGTQLDLHGREFVVEGALPVRAGVLQGMLLADERAVSAVNPGGGYELFLCKGVEKFPRELTGYLRREGCAAKLAALSEVEHTYIVLFLALGGIGVVFGLLGLALLIGANAAAREGELAVLRACGVPLRVLKGMVFWDTAAPALAGLVFGLLSALLAVRPVATVLGQEVPWGLVAALTGAMFAVTLLALGLGVKLVLRRPVVAVLKGE